MKRITPDNIQELKENEIFVFGSNSSGVHGKGAARLAYDKFGAVWGESEGLQGQSYAIPTKDKTVLNTLKIEYIVEYINNFINFAKDNQDLIFFVTEIGCGYAGYKPIDIAPLFKECENMENVYLPESFWKIIMDEIFIKREHVKTISGDDTNPFCRYVNNISLNELLDKLNNINKQYKDKYFNLKLNIKEYNGIIDIDLYGDRKMNEYELKEMEKMKVIFRIKDKTSDGFTREDLI